MIEQRTRDRGRVKTDDGEILEKDVAIRFIELSATYQRHII